MEIRAEKASEAGLLPGSGRVDDGGPGGHRVLLDGLGFPESTRWHGGRVWFCNWGAGEVVAVTYEGERK